MYFVEKYYTDEIIDVFDNFDSALLLAKSIPDSIVTDENDNVFYTNIELPF